MQIVSVTVLAKHQITQIKKLELTLTESGILSKKNHVT